jgi:hypothetical protein
MFGLSCHICSCSEKGCLLCKIMLFVYVFYAKNLASHCRACGLIQSKCDIPGVQTGNWRFSEFLQFPLTNNHSTIAPFSMVYDSPDQAAH